MTKSGIIDGVTVSSSFTQKGDYFALLSIDGRLRIWDTVSGNLLQEFTPTSHLETTYTCLCWIRNQTRRKKGVKGKKRKLDDKKGDCSDENVYPNIALGTSNGKVLVYDPTSAEIIDKYVDGHTKRVNSLCFSDMRDSLYSCSSDCNIIEWEISANALKSKWKGDSISVERITLPPGHDALLSAGKLIKLWCIETKNLLQTFNGHTSSVSLIDFTNYRHNYNGISSEHNGVNGVSSENSDVNGRYFLSGSVDDRIINVWQVNIASQEKSSVASFMLSDVPVAIDSFIQKDSDKPMKVSVACRDGKIHFFANSLHGKTKKPLVSEKLLYVLEKEGKKSNTTPLPFLKCIMKEENESIMLSVAGGSSIRPRFDTYEYSKLTEFTKVVHKVSTNLLLKGVSKETEGIVDFAKQTCQTRVINNVEPFVNTKSISEITIGEKFAEEKSDELSLEERLNVKATSHTVAKANLSGQKPNALSLANNLIQGLHSGDDNMINSILFNESNERTMHSTIQRIPSDVAVKLCNSIIVKLHENPSRSGPLLAWLRTVMLMHMSYLLANPSLKDMIGSLYELLKKKSDIYPQLHRLEGKIDFLLSNVSQNKRDLNADDIAVSAIVYNDESDSDETEVLIGTEIESDDDKWRPSDDESEVEENDRDSNGEVEDIVENMSELSEDREDNDNSADDSDISDNENTDIDEK